VIFGAAEPGMNIASERAVDAVFLTTATLSTSIFRSDSPESHHSAATYFILQLALFLKVFASVLEGPGEVGRDSGAKAGTSRSRIQN